MFSIAAVVAIVGATTVIAQTDPIAARKVAMKNVGAATGAGAKMAKGETAFSLDEAKKTFQVYIDVAKVMPSLYPDNSKTGGDTSAAPKVWEDSAGFKAAFVKWGTESEQALGGVKDLATFQAAFGNVTKNCGSCHETFRVKR
jgi:cytochrome c556